MKTAPCFTACRKRWDAYVFFARRARFVCNEAGQPIIRSDVRSLKQCLKGGGCLGRLTILQYLEESV